MSPRPPPDPSRIPRLGLLMSRPTELTPRRSPSDAGGTKAPDPLVVRVGKPHGPISEAHSAGDHLSLSEARRLGRATGRPGVHEPFLRLGGWDGPREGREPTGHPAGGPSDPPETPPTTCRRLHRPPAGDSIDSAPAPRSPPAGGCVGHAPATPPTIRGSPAGRPPAAPAASAVEAPARPVRLQPSERGRGRRARTRSCPRAPRTAGAGAMRSARARGWNSPRRGPGARRRLRAYDSPGLRGPHGVARLTPLVRAAHDHPAPMY